MADAGNNPAGNKARIDVEVAYARAHDQRILSLQVPEGSTVLEAVQLSGIQEYFPEIDMNALKLGIFGKAVARPGERKICEGERIEIYRPLIADPKEVRRKRAEQAKLKKETVS